MSMLRLRTDCICCSCPSADGRYEGNTTVDGIPVPPATDALEINVEGALVPPPTDASWTASYNRCSINCSLSRITAVNRKLKKLTIYIYHRINC
jgi:hypothetical protein